MRNATGQVNLEWLLLPLWAALYFVAYTLLGVTRYFWYYAPLVPGLIGLVGVGLEMPLQGLAKRWRGLRRWEPWAVGVALSVLFINQSETTVQYSFLQDPRIPVYREVGEWLAQRTPPAATVGALEVGAIGYYSRRPMVDFAGLIQPQVAQQITPASTYNDTALWAVRHYHPNYVVLQANRLPELAQSSLFQDHCQPVHTVAYPSNSETVEIWECQWPG